MIAVRGPHDHGLDLPVLVGPAVLQVLLVAGGLVVVTAVGLRPFVDPDLLTARAATVGAAGAGVALLLGSGPAEGMPTGGLAAAGVLGLALPVVALRGARPRLRLVTSRLAPLVVLSAGAAALAAGTAVGALYAAAVALSWSVLCRPARRPVLPALAALGAVGGVPLLLLGVALGLG